MHDTNWMQPFDKFKLAIAILWSLFTLYAVMLLLPPMHRRLRESEIKRKRGKGKPAAPNRPQRVVFLLLTCLMTAVAFANVFHRDLGELTGVGATKIVFLMVFLPALYFLFGMLMKPQQNRQQPDA